jgi:hypothetical protein
MLRCAQPLTRPASSASAAAAAAAAAASQWSLLAGPPAEPVGQLLSDEPVPNVKGGVHGQ